MHAPICLRKSDPRDAFKQRASFKTSDRETRVLLSPLARKLLSVRADSLSPARQRFTQDAGLRSASGSRVYVTFMVQPGDK